ncbi:MAG: hypothetical protein ACR2FY_03595 [Pirellulaceae bacterium]
MRTTRLFWWRLLKSRSAFSPAHRPRETPQEEVVVKLTSMAWQQHDYGDFYTDFSAGASSDVMFAEFPDVGAGIVLHDTVDVKLTVLWPADSGGRTANFFVRIFDPDHASSDNGHDTNGSTPDDNYTASGFVAMPGGGLASQGISFFDGETESIEEFTITARQPGNNFIVAGSGRRDWINAATFAADGTTILRKSGGTPIPPTCQTRVLTVWRTLNIEEDSMDAPGPFETFDGAGVGNDDVNPGNLGNGQGTFGQPSLALLTTEAERANVRVRVIGPFDDSQDDAPFVHNLGVAPLPTVLYGNAVRDVDSRKDFWVIQVFAAYEYDPRNDYDPLLGVAETAILGNTAFGAGTKAPVNVYLETIRDVGANFPGAVDEERLRRRVVVHESLHRFGHLSHDVGIMDERTLATGSDNDNILLGSMLREISVAEKP